MSPPILITAQLKLISWHRDDIDALHRLWTDPQVRRYLFDDVVIARATATDIVEAAVERRRATLLTQWSLRLLESPDEIIGFSGLRWLDETSRQPELMYGLAGSHWGRGLAIEAAQAVLVDGFTRLDFDTIWASTDPSNSASIRVMQRLGMSPCECPLAAAGLISYRIRRDDPRPLL